MGPIGRLKRCALLLEPRVESAFIRHDLVRWEFDMLATLRRAGSPFILSHPDPAFLYADDHLWHHDASA